MHAVPSRPSLMPSSSAARRYLYTRSRKAWLQFCELTLRLVSAFAPLKETVLSAWRIICRRASEVAALIQEGHPH
jgi:hypothetical protein